MIGDSRRVRSGDPALDPRRVGGRLPPAVARAGHVKELLDAYAAIRVWPLAASWPVRRSLLGEERAYLELSERAARWPGIVGERKRAALHRALGTPIGAASVLRFGCILERPPLRIGALISLGHYAKIQHATIGDNCLIGDHTFIVDGRRQHGLDRLDLPINSQPGSLEQVHIGDDCLIGAHAVVMADVGDHCVVGAGSVVLEPVAPYTIVAGNPARVIGDRRERARP
jgi:virginiamycin A acetyltransferase